jgi:hypothetical protein
VLGFDSPTSVDHDWGPHVIFFFSPLDYVASQRKVDQMLKKHLPYEYKGFSTNFENGDKYNKDKPVLKIFGPGEAPVPLLDAADLLPALPRDTIIAAKPVPSYQDWLLFPQQALIEVTAGKALPR